MDADKPVTAVDLVSPAGPGKAKSGIWLLEGLTSRRCQVLVIPVPLKKRHRCCDLRFGRVADVAGKYEVGEKYMEVASGVDGR